MNNSKHSKDKPKRKAETVGNDQILAGVHFERCTPAFSFIRQILLYVKASNANLKHFPPNGIKRMVAQHTKPKPLRMIANGRFINSRKNFAVWNKCNNIKAKSSVLIREFAIFALNNSIAKH